MIIFLVGMPGVGKSYWKKKLSRHFGWEAIDTDHYVTELTGKSIPELFAAGEPVFRQAERQVLDQLADRVSDKPLLVSTGGGTPCFSDHMERMLQMGTVVYLKASPAFIHSRIRQSHTVRPMFAALPEEAHRTLIEDLLQSRSPFYEKATYTVDAVSATISTFAELFSSRSH